MILFESGCAYRPPSTEALPAEVVGYWENFDFEHNPSFDQIRIGPGSECEICWYVEYVTPGRIETLPNKHFRLVSSDRKQTNRRFVVSEEFACKSNSIVRLKDGLVFKRRAEPAEDPKRVRP